MLPEDNDSIVKLNFNLGGPASTTPESVQDRFSPSPSNPIRVNFADPYQKPLTSAGGFSRDPFNLDGDPTGTRTVEYGRRVGKPYTSTDVLSLNVFGREMGYEQLSKTESGRRLIEIAQNNRAGKKRGFLDALTDFSVSDLPFLSLFATVGKSVSDAVTVLDTMKKLQNGEAVSDDELIKTRLSIAENEYRSNGTWGAMVGDIVRAAPGFMAEFFVSGGLYSAARVGATKALGAGIHLGMSRGSKILAREATEKLAGEFTEKTVGKLGSKAFADLATDGSKDVIVSRVAGQLTNFMKGEGAALYKGFSDDAITAMAKSRAEYEFGKMLSRNGGTALSNGFNKFTQWMGTKVSRGLMDFGHFGTEEATVLFTRQTTAGRALADAVGTFLVEAPIKGAMLMAPNQFVAKPIIGSVIGKDGRTVSEAQLSLQQAALRTGNKALMADAESIAFGVNMLEYVSENTGRGLKSLIAAAGIGLEKAGVKGLVRPLTKSVTEAGGLVDEADDAVSIGGKIRKFITDKFGTRESFRDKMSKERVRLAAERLGVSEADIRPAILANSVEGLSPELKSAIGGDVTKFVNETVDLAYKSGRRDLEYESYARFAVANWMTKHNVGPETVMNLYEQMGYDGILGEMFEERYSDVVKGMLGLDDREEHDFFSNLKEAVKGLYPGWDQLTAEAVGFAMPMVSRAGVLRLQSAVGGKGKIDQIRAHLECIDDAMRHDSSVQMTHGQYLETHDLLTRRDANELEKLRSARTDAEKAKDENLVKQLDSEISTLEKVSARRQERHQKFVGSLAEEAKSNVDAMVVVPLLSNSTLADDEKYNLTPAINSAQASEGLAGQTAIVEFAPELARRLYEAEAQLEGEKDTWYRRAAHKIIGIAGFLATGDISMAASNPTQWTARDMGLSSTVVNQLKNGFKDAYLQARRDLVNGRIGPRAEMSRIEKEIANLEKTGADAVKLAEDRTKLDELRKSNSGPAYAVPVALAMEEAQKAFATRAQQIMSANLTAHQLRSFSDGRMRDQAIAHVAANYREDGDERQYNYSVGQDGKVSFYKLTEDGSGVDESTVLTADEFYSRNKEAVDKAHKEIAAATVSLLTRGLTKSDSADRRLLNTIRMNADSELLSAAITDAAMHMIGQEDLLYRVRIDGKTPVADVIRSQSVGQTNMKVVDYIATKDDAEQVDARAYESVAHSLGFRFDGSEAGYKARNEKIFRLAKLATLMRRNGLEFFSKAIVENEKDSRLSANGVMTLRAVRQSDNTYLVDFGLKQDGSKDERPYATREEMVADLAKLGYNEDSARIVFTQSKVVESTDMFHMIRELGLGREYADLLREAKNNDTHPMLRTGAEGELLDEDAAAALLRAEIAAAEKGRHAEKGTADRRAYERLWGETGYMAIGEALLKAHGVGINTVSKYAGEFSDYDPKLYTVRLNAGRLSSKSADIYVSIDPSVNSDITSGVVNALLLNAYHFNARLLRNELKGTVSEFVRQIDTVVDKALADAKDKKDYELVNSLEAFRNLCTREVDRVQRGDDGVLRVQRGAGMTAVGFTTMASAFCLFRDQEYRDNPFLRAVAVIADDVRQLPAYSDFLNLVDLTLGGSGFLTEAFRNAMKENPAAASQTGVIRLMTYASGDPAAFSKAIRKSLPGGMSYTSFLNVCMRRLQAMSKSGTPVFTEADKAELKAQAELAEKAKDTSVSEHFTFLGNLIGTVKGVLAMADNGKEIPGRFTDFMKEVAEDAKADPNTTEDQRKAINAMLAILGRKSTADASIEEYEKALAKVQEADAQAADLRTKLDSANSRIVALENGVKAAADKLGGTSEEDAKVRDEIATLRAALDTVVAQRASAFEELTKLNVPGVVKKAAINAGNTGASWINDADVVENEEEDPDADITLSVGNELILDLPGAFEKAAGLENNGFLVNRGNVAREDDGHLMTRSQARLAANIVVRSVLATEGDVSESTVVERLRELFPAMVQSEIDDVTSAFRTLDDLRIRGRLGSLDWRKAVESGKKWTFAEDTKEDDSVSSDDFNDRSLSEYNSEAMADFLALAQRSTPETGRNLQGFLKLAKDVAREYTGDDPSALFLRDFLNPKLDTTLKTQAEHSAVHLETIGEFDDSRVDGYVKGLLAKTDGQPLSRRGAFILSYLSSLPRNARVKFGLLCANSVSASPVHLNTDSGLMENARRKSGGKVPESLVVDGFSVLVGKSASFAAECAKKLRTAMAELNTPGSGLLGIPTDSKGNLKKSGDIVGVVNANAKLVADVFAKVFGRESPLVSALASSLTQRHRSTLSEEFMLTLAKSVTFQVPAEYAEPEIGLIETVASGLDVLAKYKGTLTRTDVASVFTAVFATDNASRKGLRMAPSTSYVTSPLLSFLSSFEDSLPETIMTAEIDQSRESKGSSVAIAPRDMIPLLARWLYADARTVTTVKVDGKDVKLMSFADACAKFFGVTDEKVIAECRQDATWPDEARTPICAKSISTSYNTREIYNACEKAYDAMVKGETEATCYWIPIYAGDHASSTLLQVPKDVDFHDLTSVQEGAKESVDPKVTDAVGRLGKFVAKVNADKNRGRDWYARKAFAAVADDRFDGSWDAGVVSAKADEILTNIDVNGDIVEGSTVMSQYGNPDNGHLMNAGDERFTKSRTGRDDGVFDAIFAGVPEHARRKDFLKMTLANQFIGFGSPGSSTERYASRLRDVLYKSVNSGNYSRSTVAFVSVNGRRGDGADGESQYQLRTYAEAVKAILSGATLITDGMAYAAKSDYNIGERRLAEILHLLGAKAEQVDVGDYGGGMSKVSRWTLDENVRKELAKDPVKALAELGVYRQIKVGDKEFYGHEVVWEKTSDGHKSFAWTTPADGVIHICVEAAKQKFAEKAWTNPERSAPVKEHVFETLDDLIQFAALHEYGHSQRQWNKSDEKAYETWVNNWAIRRMGKYAEVASGKPVPPKRTDYADDAAFHDAIEEYRDAMIDWKASIAEGTVSTASLVKEPPVSRIPVGVAAEFAKREQERLDLTVALSVAQKKDEAPKRPSYEANAEAACSAVGLSLMFTDTKRSAVSSLEAEGVGMIGTKMANEFTVTDVNGEIERLKLDFDKNYYYVHRTSKEAADNILSTGFKAGPEITGTAMLVTSAEQLAQMFRQQMEADVAEEWSDAVKGGTHAVVLAMPKSEVFTGTDRSRMTSKISDSFFDKYQGNVPKNEVVGVIPVYSKVEPKRTFGENRVHIARNWAYEDPSYVWKNPVTGEEADKNAAFLGSTFLRGYGAKALKAMAQDPKSSTLKAHIISTYGQDLFFSKSLCVSPDGPGASGEFLENSSGRAVMDYLAKFRGSDELSTDLFTDYDSYKIGPAASKALMVRDAKDKPSKVMQVVFDKLYDAMVADGLITKDLKPGTVLEDGTSSTDLIAKAMKDKYGAKVSGKELDELVGPLEVVDKVRGDRSGVMLSEILPGAKVSFVEGMAGAALDLSYQENGAMAYTVANVSHNSKIPAEVGASPRNYEVDAMTMAMVLARGGWMPQGSKTSRTVMNLIADWGLVANAVYSDPGFVDALVRQSEALGELARYGENPNGQNAREELARQLWAKIRQESNLPLSGIDAPLVSCGAAIDVNGKLITHAKSLMQRAMMKGSELFSEEESRFYGTNRRMALCNVNVSSNTFRYGWFLAETIEDQEAADFFAECEGLAVEDVANRRFGTDFVPTEGRMKAIAVSRMFQKLREASKAAVGEKSGPAVDELKRIRKCIANCFIDHHGNSIAAKGDKYVQSFGFEDLFMENPEAGDDTFDLSAVQCEGVDLVRNDATGRDHVFLGGTMFGLPRTPSYNGSMWLQTVRAGLPVTEKKVVREVEGKEVTTFYPGNDAMVSPDPYTNKILGCDHDGDKTKIYMFSVDANGRVDFGMPPSPHSSVDANGDTVFDPDQFLENRKVPNPDYGKPDEPQEIGCRDLYLRQVARKRIGEGGMIDKFRFDPETGSEEKVAPNDPRPGCYYKISEFAKKRVSNTFVRCLFNMARRLPTGLANDVDGSVVVTPRWSEGSGSTRAKFLGGVASSPTKAFPVADKESLTKGNIGPEKIPSDGRLGTLGKPKLAADVSASAADAADARAMAVSMARTLHLAWATGYFHGGRRNLFGDRFDSTAWLRFMYHVDGLSNATFDDIKEQICGRLGWTKDMMDTVITELLVNASGNGKLPTTDAEFAKVLGAYSKDINSKGANYWMLKAASVSDEDGVHGLVLQTFGGRELGKTRLLGILGIDGDGSEDNPFTAKAVGTKMTAAQALVAGLVASKAVDSVGSSRLLGIIANEVAGRQMHNVMIGRLFHLARTFGVTDGTKELSAEEATALIERVAKSGEPQRFCDWASKRSVLLGARSFGQSVNYMTADPGDPGAAGKSDAVADSYSSMKDFLKGGRDTPTGANDGLMSETLKRMHAATRLAYDIGNGLQTIAARAVTAATRRRSVLFPRSFESARFGSDAKKAALARMLLRDSMSQTDRLGLEANAQQIPYLCAFFSGFGSLASRVAGTDIVSGRQMYDAMKAVASGVRGNLGTNGSALEFRRGIESMFEIMYELMITSQEFAAADGDKAPAYLRSANDTAYGETLKEYTNKLGESKLRRVKQYGDAGTGLKRIMALFRANDDESVGRIKEMFGKIISGTAYSGSRGLENRNAKASCRTFSISTKSIVRYVVELTGRTPPASAGREFVLSAMDTFAGIDETAIGNALKAELKFKESERMGRDQIVANMRKSNERYRVVLDAYAAAEALEARFGKDFEMTPAKMFGQFLPAYSLMTSRTLGAPTPNSPSFLNLLPSWYYSELSDRQVELDTRDHDFMSLLIGTNFAPVNEYDAAWRGRETEGKKSTLAKKVGDIAPLIALAEKAVDETGKLDSGATDYGALGDALESLRDEFRGEGTGEARSNPDYRNTLDIMSDDLFGHVIDYFSETGATQTPAPKPTKHDYLKDGAYDPKVAKVALAMGSLLGSWATVEYNGGTTFVIKGRLRGNAGLGKECVITVDASADGMTCETDAEVTALAESEAFAASLCACADIGTDAEGFMKLPLEVRKQFVRKFKMGAATFNKVVWSADGKGLATLVGAIKAPAGTSGTKIYHEYFHAMMRMFDQIGLLGDADKAALAKQFGKGKWDRAAEEKAAEAFRKWVEDNTNADSEDTRSVFRKIFDFLRGFFEALCHGFNYTGEVSDDTIFKMMVHGIAQASDARVAELAAGNEKLAKARADGDDIAVASILRRTFVLPRKDFSVPVEHQMKVASEGLASSLNRMLDPDSGANPEAIKSATAELAGQASEKGGEAYLATEPADPVEEALDKVTFPQVEANDFYRASNMIGEALVNSLKETGSWNAPLEAVIRRYAAPEWNDSTTEAKDRLTVLRGLRQAYASLNPEVARRMSEGESFDKELTDSLVFEAALRMYHSLDRSFVRQTGAVGGTGTGMKVNPAGSTAATSASAYQVSAWIVSSRPTAAASVVTSARERIAFLANRAKGTVEQAEMKLHLDMMEKLSSLVDDPTHLMDFRYSQGMDVLNEVIGRLRSGTKRPTYDENGFMNAIRPIDVADPNDELTPENIGTNNQWSADHLATFLQSWNDADVQESLKLALSTAYQVAAMAKFFRELDTVPVTSADDLVFRNQMMRRHKLPPNVSVAEWMATQAIGDSNLSDNRGLVDYCDQSFFIANNVDAWLSSLVRKSFGAKDNIGQMLMAENREYGALKSKIADLENFYSMMFGDNVEAGGEILKVLYHTGEFKMEDGTFIRKVGDTYVKFNNYGRETCKITMSERDLRDVDLYKKMLTAYACGQDRVITGVNDLHFDSTMSRNEADYTREKILAKWNGGRPTGQMNAFEIALVRLTKQVHESILDNGDGNVGLWDRLVRRALDGMAIADRTVEARVRAGLKSDEEFDESLLKGTVGSAIYNSIVIDHLVKGGLCEGMNRSEEKYRGTLIPRYTKAVVTIGVDDINDMFLNSEAYRKLTDKARGWKSEEEAKAALDRDNVSKEFMKVYSDTVRFAKQHPWLTHGDGQYFNAFGTALPFWRGSGIFMYNAVRSLRDRAAEEKRDLTDVENVMLNLMSSENSDTKVKDLDLAAYMGSEEMLANVYGLETRGAELVKDIADGKFAEGTKNVERFGLVLSADATLSDVAKAIYDRCLDQVWRIQAGNGAKMKLRDAEAVIEAYENTRLTKGELFGGSIGLNDQQMFRRTGTLPANHQIGHRVHVAIDGLTNAMMHRATFANLLMTPAFDGAPVYYADPSDVAATTSGLPDEFWAQVARWWAQYNEKNGITYDAKLSGIDNAKAIYKKLSDQRTANNGMIGIGDQAHKYTEIGKDDSEAMLSVNGWLVRNDDQYGYESSRLNALGGGEAMGYLKQFIQSNRVLGFGGAATRATLHRVLSWSKSMSVSFSFFFPLATKWESPIGAVGAMATMASNSKMMAKWAKSNPELFAGIQRMFGGSGWITKDFLGFQDIVEMMDSNDPFLAEMKAWASALGITLSTSLVNPVEPTKSVMASDIRALKEMLRDKFGAKVAAKYGRIMDAVALRQGEKAFNYALNATKLACVAQLAMKLRHEATLRGKAFDPIRDLRKYSGYINAEIGGIDPLRYAWAHPMNRGIMNALMFSWQWTRGAWEAGGGGVLEDFLFGGHSVTRQEREYMMGRWARMFGGVMIGVPAMMQVATLALAKAMGGGDDSEWFTWNNEDKTKWTAFDLTPLLKAMQQFDDTKLGGMLKDFKKNGSGATALLGAVSSGILGLRNGGNWVTGLLGAGLGGSVGAMVPSFIPMYTGDDAANRTSRGRHYYMHFGKQGWEFFRWFDAAASQFFSKLSMPTQRLLEGFMGRSLSYMERSLPWDEMGQFERWLSPTTDSALFNIAQAFLPFSVGGIQRNGDAGVLPIFGPVQMGASQTNIQKRLEKALTAWAHNDRAGYSFGTKRKGQNKATKLVAERVSDILRDAKINGFDPEDQLNKALGKVATSEYGRLFRALPENPDDAFDTREVNAAARALNRIGSKKANILKSIKDRMKTQQREWKTMPRAHRNMYRGIIETSVAEPFQTVEVPEAGLRYDY